MATCIHCGREVAELAQVCPHCGQPIAAAAAADAPVKRFPKALILILVGVGCLGLLLIGGIIAAIAIPNFLSAREQAARHQTLASMRALGAALEDYYRQNGRYPPAGSSAELLAAVSPAEAVSLSQRDGWGHEFRYLCWPAGSCEHYTLASAGKDGRFERDDLTAYQGEQTPRRDYERDLVMVDGGFLQYPGSQ